MAAKRQVRIRRAYEDPGPDDGRRVLVDRLWPRGVPKAEAALDEWAKDVAPSAELRKWYGHELAKFAEFARRYRSELAAPERREHLDGLRSAASKGTLTLVTATKDVEHSGAQVLCEVLLSR